MDLGDLLAIVLRRWKALPLILAVTVGLAGAYVLITPARYAATMSMLIDNRERGPLGADASPVRNSDPGLVEGQMRFLTSNEVLRRVVEKEHLREDPEFSGKGRFSIMGAIKSALGRAAQPPSDDQIIEALFRLITVKRNEKSYVIDIEVTASSPERAEALARALADAYFDTHAKIADERAKKEAQWLDEKVADIRKRLERAEREADDYRRSKQIVVSDGPTPLEVQLKEASAALVEARGKRSEAEAKFAQLLAASKTGAIETLGDAIKSPLIEKFRGDLAALARDAAYTQSILGARHPSYLAVQTQMAAMRAQVQQELHRIVAAQKRDLDAVRKSEEDARGLVTELQKAINSFGSDRIELGERERVVASLRVQYEKVLAARENVQREVLSTPNGVLINTPFAPKTKVSPKTLPALVIALGAGVNLWIMSALGLELRSRRQKGRQGVSEQEPSRLDASGASAPGDGSTPTALSFILPLFETSEDAGRLTGDMGMVARAQEAMTTRGALFRSAIARIFDAMWRNEALRLGAPIIAVGCRQAGTGVSTVSLSLSLFACQRGERALLIDANPKRRTFSSVLRSSARRRDVHATPYVWRRDEKSGGEIIILRLDLTRETWTRRRYAGVNADLIVLDLGATEAGGMSVRLEEIDVGIRVEADKLGGERLRLFFSPEASKPITQGKSPLGGDALAGAV